MSASLEKLLRELIRVGALVNIGLEENAPYHTSAAAGRALVKVIRKVVNDNELWWHLRTRADVHFHTASDHDDQLMLEEIADLMSEHHAALLTRMGYRTPPPPPASMLIDDGRQALAELISDRAAYPSVDATRDVLNHFVDEVLRRLPGADSDMVRRVLKRGKRLLPGIGMLVVLHPALGVETGSEFAVDFGFSTEHVVDVNVTIPRQWTEAMAAAAAINAATLNLYLEADNAGGLEASIDPDDLMDVY